jgi:hypothetical protein
MSLNLPQTCQRSNISAAIFLLSNAVRYPCLQGIPVNIFNPVILFKNPFSG